MKKPKEIILQFAKYGMVGFINFFVSLGFYYFLLTILYLNYLLAFTITWGFGILLTYTINFLWVFKPEDKITFKGRLIKYVTVYVTSYVLNIIPLRYICEHYNTNPVITQLFLLPAVVVINFIGFKYWSLK